MELWEHNVGDDCGPYCAVGGLAKDTGTLGAGDLGTSDATNNNGPGMGGNMLYAVHTLYNCKSARQRRKAQPRLVSFWGSARMWRAVEGLWLRVSSLHGVRPRD